MNRAYERDHDYRLTATDETTIRAAIRRTLDEQPHVADFHLIRAAVRSIGCSINDMRLVELEWIDDEIDAQRQSVTVLDARIIVTGPPRTKGVEQP